jgi:hypothetical protein
LDRNRVILSMPDDNTLVRSNFWCMLSISHVSTELALGLVVWIGGLVAHQMTTST